MEYKEKDFRNLEMMEEYFSQKGNYDFVSTLQLCKRALFPESSSNPFFTLEHEEEIDGLIDDLNAMTEEIPKEQSNRIEILVPYNKNALVISVGGAGHRLVNKAIERKWWPKSCFLSIDIDQDDLSNSKAEYSYLIDETPEGAVCDENVREEINAILKRERRTLAILVFSMAGRTANTGIVEELVSLCTSEYGMNVILAGYLPFSFEADHVKERAMNLKKRLEDTNSECIFIENDVVFRYCNKRTTMPYALGILAEIMGERISKTDNMKR